MHLRTYDSLRNDAFVGSLTIWKVDDMIVSLLLTANTDEHYVWRVNGTLCEFQ